jgi:hypothetical protein
MALWSGVGGGNFASSMSNISTFFPKRLQGTALGINAGVGNFGVTTMQVVIPLVMTMPLLGSFGGESMTLLKDSGWILGKIKAGTPTWIQNAGFAWVLSLVPLSILCWFGMNNLKTVSPSTGNPLVAFAKITYLYTLAWENSTRGMPLMRPLFFADESDPGLIDRSDAYFWGDAFLVRPITDKRAKRVDLALPAGVWFDFHDGTRFDGNRTVRLKTRAAGIPVLVRAGAFVPMVAPVQNTTQYSTAKLELHHWSDASVAQSSGRMYDDDGATRTAIASGAHEVLTFASTRSERGLTIDLKREGGEYAGKPATREIALVLHGWDRAPAAVTVDGRPANPSFDPKSGTLRVTFEWSGAAARVDVR